MSLEGEEGKGGGNEGRYGGQIAKSVGGGVENVEKQKYPRALKNSREERKNSKEGGKSKNNGEKESAPVNAQRDRNDERMREKRLTERWSLLEAGH